MLTNEQSGRADKERGESERSSSHERVPLDKKVYSKRRRLLHRLDEIAGQMQPAAIEECWRITAQLRELDGIEREAEKRPSTQVARKLECWLKRG
jgi:hypothetical protein